MKLLWFRRDLRTFDHPLLALKGEVLPLFIFDTTILDSLLQNDRRVTLIFSYVLNLKKELQEKGLDLAVFYGNPLDVMRYLKTQGASSVVASGDYDINAKKRDHDVCGIVDFDYVNDTYLFRSDEVKKDDGKPYHVFTPYYKKIQSLFTPHHAREILPVAQTLYPFNYEKIIAVTQNNLSYLDLSLESLGFTKAFVPSKYCISPFELLSQFKSKIDDYTKNRDFLPLDATSSLGVALRFGTLNIRTIVRSLIQWKKEGLATEPFFRQLMWREFYASLLDTYPHLTHENYKTIITPDRDNERFERFCTATTGYPIVDAAIMQLLTTGEMHNRARMICASFFVKDLLLPWQWGEKFFASHLLDYDAASNILSWQWSAGTGIDPQPFFRIFNPHLQTLKYDPQGEYIKKFLPVLSDVPLKSLANEPFLDNHTINGYPHPIVKHTHAAKIAQERLKKFKM